MRKKISLVLIFLLVVTTTFAQRAGSLDTTFNHTGIVYNTIGIDTVNGGNAMAIQPDGKIVVVGSTTLSGGDYLFGAIDRYNTDGSLDTSFNHTGYNVVHITMLSSVIIQPDGRILALGTLSIIHFVLVRFNPNGTLDSSFGNKGIDTTSIISTPSSLVLQPDGKIILGGSNGYSNFIVARFDSTGKLDNTFGTFGITTTNFGIVNATETDIESLAIQTDGKIVAAGDYTPSTITHLALIRLNTDGSFDNSFGLNGIDTNNYNTYVDGTAYSAAIQTDGKIVIGGTINDLPIIDNDTCFLARYNSNGSFDTTFANKGIAKTSINGFANSVVLQPDGKVVAVGNNVSSGFCVFRMGTTGTPDTSFGKGGYVSTLINSNPYSVARSVALQKDGKIVSAGYATDTINNITYFAVVRYNNDISTGILNLSSTPSSILVYPNPVHNTETLDYTLANDETLTINLCNVTGQVIRNYMTNEKMLTGEHKQQLNFENLAAGAYILTISNAEGKTESIKIVKQ